MRTLRVDTSWCGEHGIGRYSREVLSRLKTSWNPLKVLGNPGSIPNLFFPRIAKSSDLIYSPGYNAGLAGATQVVTVHDLIHLETDKYRYRAYYDHVVRPAIVKARIVFTVSQTSRIAIESWVDDSRVDVIVTGNGCSDEFSCERSMRDGSSYLVYVGNDKKHKNFDVLLRTIAYMRELELVAVMPDHARAAARAFELGISERVRFVSGLPDANLCDLYRGAIATVMPSTIEGFGLPAVESLASGTPVVYWAGCASIAEIVGTAGIGVQSSSDVAEWAQAIETLRVTDIGFDPQSIKSLYSWDKVAGIIDTTLRSKLSEYV